MKRLEEEMPHLFEGLKKHEKKALLESLDLFYPDFYEEQKEGFKAYQSHKSGSDSRSQDGNKSALSPSFSHLSKDNADTLTLFLEEESPKFIQEGEKLFSQGNVAILLLAGGEGSRLGMGVKGCLPIQGEKTLFDLFFEKWKKGGERFDSLPHVVILTSLKNEPIIRAFLETRGFYGERDSIHFIVQGIKPYLNEKGEWFLEKKGTLAQGPDGNGSVFKALVKASCYAKLKNRGVTSLLVLPIDNPLADPFDTALVGALNSKELAVRALSPILEGEKVGVFSLEENRLKVIEYSEREEGEYSRYWVGYSGLFSASLSWVEKVAFSPLPWHIARKKVSVLLEGQEQTVTSFKWEKFIYDAFCVAHSFSLLLTEREKYFFPIKTKEDKERFQRST